MLNRSLLIGLTLSLSMKQSSLFSVPATTNHVRASFSNLRLSKFAGHAFFTQRPLACNVHASSFSSFLRTPLTVNSACVALDLMQYLGTHQAVLENCLTVTNCTFTSCSNPGGDGGGIEVNCTTAFDVTVRDSEFTACLSSFDGGALHILLPAASTVQITFNYFAMCYTNYLGTQYLVNDTYGGAVYVDSLGDLVNLSCNIFARNMVQGVGSGGAVYVHGNGVDLRYCIFVDCNATDTASSYGGGVYILCANAKNPLITPTQVFALELSFISFSNCNAYYGAAIYIDNATDEAIRFDTTVFNNCSDLETASDSTLGINISASAQNTTTMGITIVTMVFDDPRITTASLRRLIGGPAEMQYLNQQQSTFGTIYLQNQPQFDVVRQFDPDLPLTTGWIVIRPITDFRYGVAWPYDPTNQGLPPVPPPVAANPTMTPTVTPTITATAAARLSTVAIVFIVIAILAFIFAMIGLTVCLCKLESCRRCVNRKYAERVTAYPKAITYF